MEDLVSKVVLKNTVTTRRIPMTEEGMTRLRDVREYYRDKIETRLKRKVELPFPSVIDMMLTDFTKEHNIDSSTHSSDGK